MTTFSVIVPVYKINESETINITIKIGIAIGNTQKAQIINCIKSITIVM